MGDDDGWNGSERWKMGDDDGWNGSAIERWKMGDDDGWNGSGRWVMMMMGEMAVEDG